jgi:hypothetical protein
MPSVVFAHASKNIKHLFLCDLQAKAKIVGCSTIRTIGLSVRHSFALLVLSTGPRNMSQKVAYYETAL